MKLSFILPCYNIERFVEPCIKSIYEQNLDINDYEIICVNDCSPDHTREIICNLQKTYPNIVLIDHTVNKRVGAARNTGFMAAKGEYVWFIDPDDLLNPNSAKKLLSLLDKNNLDFIQFGHDWMTESETPINNPPFNHNCHFNTDVLSGIDFIHLCRDNGINYNDFHVGCFVRIYRKNFLTNNKIQFPEVAYYEDQYMALHALLCSQRLMNINENYYHYRVVETSYSHVPMSISKQASQLLMCTGMLKMMHEYGISESDIEYIWKRYHGELKYVTNNHFLYRTYHDRHYIINAIKPELAIIYRYLPNANRILCQFPNLYLAFCDLFHYPAIVTKWLLRQIHIK